MMNNPNAPQIGFGSQAQWHPLPAQPYSANAPTQIQHLPAVHTPDSVGRHLQNSSPSYVINKNSGSLERLRNLFPTQEKVQQRGLVRARLQSNPSIGDIWQSWKRETRDAAQTSFDEAFGSRDETFSDSGILKGVPLIFMTIDEFESSNHWQKQWRTLEEWISMLESSDIEFVRDFYYDKFKIHPCQLISEKYIGSQGLIDPGFLKSLARVGNSLQTLKAGQLINMEWLHFFLWRVSLKAQSMEFAKLGKELLMIIADPQVGKGAVLLSRMVEAGVMLYTQNPTSNADEPGKSLATGLRSNIEVNQSLIGVRKRTMDQSSGADEENGEGKPATKAKH